MKKLLFVSGIVGSVLFGFSLVVLATSPFDITFPIPELSNCQNETECRAFCDEFANKDACITFAQKHGLASEEQAEEVRALPSQGPGGCESESECRAYCDDSSHVEECLAFAEEHGLIEEEELERIRELTEDAPGGCTNPQECRAYCEDPDNQDECLDFAEEHGLIPPEELERARIVSKQGGPGGCKSEAECRAYCQDPNHTEECIDSAVELGFLNKEEASRIKKAAVLGGPGGCKGEECRTYCEDPVHQSECIAFAEENGFMSPEDAARARKFAGKTGPGGCKGSECRDFCERTENAPVCLEFAEREGLIPPEEVARARKFLAVSEQGGPGGCKGIECRDYCQDPGHQDECFAFAKGNGLLRAEDEQNFEAGRKLQQVVQESGGPGGCKNDQECRVFCTDALHVEECVAFGATHGGIPESQAREMLRQFTEQRFHEPGEFRPPEDFRRFEQESQKRFEEFRALEGKFRGKEFGPPGVFPGAPGGPGGAPSFAGPGGCTSPAECIKYCTEHKDECFSFGPPGQPQATPREGGVPPGREFGPPKGEFAPRLQENLIREFKREELRQFQQQQFQTEEQKKEFFKQKFEEFREGEEFPGKSPEGFTPPERFVCTQQYDPVCGGDGRTYSNECVAKTKGVRIAYTGECKSTEGGFLLKRGEICPAAPYIPCPAGTVEKTYTNRDGCPVQQCIPAGEVPPATGTIPPTLGDERAKACAAEGGVWDGTTCRPPQSPTQFFPETQIFQEQVQQTQRQIQEQQIQQEIQQQTQQLQQLQQQLQVQPPPSFTPPAGGSLIDAVRSFLRLK